MHNLKKERFLSSRMQHGVSLTPEQCPSQMHFQSKTQPAPKVTTLEPKRDLGHHSGGCWFGHRPVCTWSSASSPHRDYKATEVSADAAFCNRNVGKRRPWFSSEEQFFIPPPSYGSATSCGYGELTGTKTPLLKKTF